MVVPAKVELIRVWPRRVAWGDTVRIVGKLDGGYLPPGGALVRLRLGQGSGYTTYGVQEHVTGNGRFATTYTFGAGPPSVHQTFWFQIASLPMGGDYPGLRQTAARSTWSSAAIRHPHHHGQRHDVTDTDIAARIGIEPAADSAVGDHQPSTRVVEAAGHCSAVLEDEGGHGATVPDRDS